jgi:hypothetical protein
MRHRTRPFEADIMQIRCTEPRYYCDPITAARIGRPFRPLLENFLRPPESMYCLPG